MNWKNEFAYQGESIYFDNAATTQKLKVVVESLLADYGRGVAAYGRGSGPLATATREDFEQAKRTIAAFYGARDSELIFTKSATESLNLVARNLKNILQPGDEMVISVTEHNSVYLPLKRLAERNNLIIHFLPLLGESGGEVQLDLAKLRQLLARPAVRLVALGAMSNVLGGARDPEKIDQIIKRAKKRRAPDSPLFWLCDCAGKMLTSKQDFTSSSADFAAFSWHKMYAPHVGGLLVKEKIVKSAWWQPQDIGGGTVSNVNSQASVQVMLIPDKAQQFLAGVPDVASMKAAAAALTWFEQYHFAHEQYLAEMIAYLTAKIAVIPGVVVLGGVKTPRLNLVSFYHEAFSSLDIGLVLSQHGVDCRVGTHCSDLLYEHLGVKDSVRLSLAAYNDAAQIDKVVIILQQLPQFLYQTRL